MYNRGFSACQTRRGLILSVNALDVMEVLSLASAGLEVWTILAAYAFFRSLVHTWWERAWHEKSKPT